MNVRSNFQFESPLHLLTREKLFICHSWQLTPIVNMTASAVNNADSTSDVQSVVFRCLIMRTYESKTGQTGVRFCKPTPISQCWKADSIERQLLRNFHTSSALSIVFSISYYEKYASWYFFRSNVSCCVYIINMIWGAQ